MIIKEYLTHKPLNSTVELSRPEVCRFAPVLFGAEPNAFASLLLRPQLSNVDPLLVLPGVYSPHSSQTHRPGVLQGSGWRQQAAMHLFGSTHSCHSRRPTDFNFDGSMPKAQHTCSHKNVIRTSENKETDLFNDKP